MEMTHALSPRRALALAAARLLSRRLERGHGQAVVVSAMPVAQLRLQPAE
jgi:hypothetical protein